MEAKVPIIPVVIRNAHDAMPRGSSVFRPTAIEVIALPPVSTKRWRKDRLDHYISKVRAMFLKELGQEDEKAKSNGFKVKKNGQHPKTKKRN